MLILNNGVPKSGSTWIHNVVRQALKPAFPAEQWQNGWGNPSIDEDRLQAYVDSGEWRLGPTLVKLHLMHAPHLDYLFRDDVRIIVSHRDLAESVVSWFHHQTRQGKVAIDRQEWFQTVGRRFAARAVRYRQSWTGRPNTLLIRYEDMVRDAPTEVIRLMAFLDHPVTAERAAALAGKTQVAPPATVDASSGQSHIRTAGRRVAQDELPADLYADLGNLSAAVESGLADEALLRAFVARGTRPAAQQLHAAG